MLMIVTGSTRELPPGLEVALATYRHEVFIEGLQWQLPAKNGLERDQFDREDTLYAVARDPHDGRICGCARLLPTTKAYLLDEIFPELMNGLPAPHSPEIWELSRFSTLSNGSFVVSREQARARFCQLFAAVVELATSHGAGRLVTVTALGVERILRSIGIHAHRVGPPRPIDGKPTLALWIELDVQTRQSLNLSNAAPSGAVQ